MVSMSNQTENKEKHYLATNLASYQHYSQEYNVFSFSLLLVVSNQPENAEKH